MYCKHCGEELDEEPARLSVSALDIDIRSLRVRLERIETRVSVVEQPTQDLSALVKRVSTLEGLMTIVRSVLQRDGILHDPNAATLATLMKQERAAEKIVQTSKVKQKKVR